MKAKVIPAYNRGNRKDCWMIAIQAGKKGSRYNKFLSENNKPYFTYHKEEAVDKAKELNFEFTNEEN